MLSTANLKSCNPGHSLVPDPLSESGCRSSGQECSCVQLHLHEWSCMHECMHPLLVRNHLLPPHHHDLSHWSAKPEKLGTADLTNFIFRETAICTANTCLNQTQKVDISFHAVALISFSMYYFPFCVSYSLDSQPFRSSLLYTEFYILGREGLIFSYSPKV